MNLNASLRELCMDNRNLGCFPVFVFTKETNLRYMMWFHKAGFQLTYPLIPFVILLITNNNR